MKKIKLTRGKFAIVDDESFKKFGGFTWHCTEHGYVSRKDSTGKSHYLHRDIMNPKPGMVIDHINGDRADNRKQNLRECTQAQNTWNKKHHFGAVPFPGVYMSDPESKRGWNLKKKYAARINVSGKRIWLGRYATPEEASKVYQEARIKYHGEFSPKL